MRGMPASVAGQAGPAATQLCAQQPVSQYACRQVMCAILTIKSYRSAHQSRVTALPGLSCHRQDATPAAVQRVGIGRERRGSKQMGGLGWARQESQRKPSKSWRGAAEDTHSFPSMPTRLQHAGLALLRPAYTSGCHHPARRHCRRCQQEQAAQQPRHAASLGMRRTVREARRLSEAAGARWEEGARREGPVLGPASDLWVH